MQDRSDQDLLREFVGRGSEEAFAELSRRHVSLVFGTAKRKLGEGSWAEEVSQLVFIALARKAPFLCHHENLSGWLHRTALLEARQFLRGELRRRRREESVMNDFDADRLKPGLQTAELAGEVDEALLELGEKDRQPLLLRFFEGMSLQEVAGALGIKEDAAQKRVAKSLGLLERVLKRRGKDVGAGALGSALAGVADAAPAHLAGSVAQGALAAGGSTAFYAVLFGKFMATTKTKMAVVCLLALGAPLLMQNREVTRAEVKQRQMAEERRALREQGTLRVERIERQTVALRNLEEDRRVIQRRLERGQSRGAAPKKVDPNLYRWSEGADFVRLPKSILEEAKLTAVTSTNSQTGLANRVDPFDINGNFSPALVEALDLTGDQVGALTASLEHYRQQFEWLAKQHTVLTNALPPGISFSTEDGKLYTLWTKEFPEEGEALRKQFVAEWEGLLGAERAKTLMQQGQWTIERAFLDFGNRESWLAAGWAGNGMVAVGRSWTKDGVSSDGNVTYLKPEKVPEELRMFFVKEDSK